MQDTCNKPFYGPPHPPSIDVDFHYDFDQFFIFIIFLITLPLLIINVDFHYDCSDPPTINVDFHYNFDDRPSSVGRGK